LSHITYFSQYISETKKLGSVLEIIRKPDGKAFMAPKQKL